MIATYMLHCIPLFSLPKKMNLSFN